MLSDQDIVWKALISLLQRLVDQQDIGFENAKPMQDFVVTSLQILRALIHLPTGDHPEEVINRFWAAYIAGESPSAQGVERRQGKMSDLGAAALATSLFLLTLFSRIFWQTVGLLNKFFTLFSLVFFLFFLKLFGTFRNILALFGMQ